jgi:hypothetical protein
MKRKIIVGLALIGIPLAAWANCTYQTYWIGGKYTTCTTCCYGNTCNTSCY